MLLRADPARLVSLLDPYVELLKDLVVHARTPAMSAAALHALMTALHLSATAIAAKPKARGGRAAGASKPAAAETADDGEADGQGADESTLQAELDELDAADSKAIEAAALSGKSSAPAAAPAPMPLPSLVDHAGDIVRYIFSQLQVGHARARSCLHTTAS